MRPRPGPCDVAFGDAPITKYHPRGPGLRLVKRNYYTCAGSPRGIGTRIHTPAPAQYRTVYPRRRARGPRVPLPGRAGSISFGFAQERRLDLIKEIEPETFGCLFLAQNRLHPPSRRVSPIEYWICTVEYCLDL